MSEETARAAIDRAGASNVSVYDARQLLEEHYEEHFEELLQRERSLTRRLSDQHKNDPDFAEVDEEEEGRFDD
jgi:hypothetical protein